ncbi:MAG: HD domain-containing protein [Candidatus Magasanikbacteria bacterium]
MDVKKIFATIHKISKQQKIEVYAVGGYVRDILLDVQKKKDIDFVVVGSGLEFAKKFAENWDEEGTLIEFPDFDTARFVFTRTMDLKVEEPDKFFDENQIKKEKLFEIEFAGARTEKYEENSRKPKVVATDLHTDLERRDFTVNAMARKIIATGLSKKVEDPFAGQIDLQNNLLRTPLDPDITFSEDPLRMLRAARFASQLNFEIDKKTYQAIKTNKERLKIISAERIQEEFFKLLSTPKPSIGLWILYETGLLQEFLPEVCDLWGVEEVYGHTHKNNLAHTFQVVDNLAERSDKVLLRYAALMHDIGKPGTKQFEAKRGWTFDMHEHLGRKIVRDISKRLRMSKQDSEYVSKLVRWHQQPIALMDKGITDSPVRRLVVNLGDELDDLLILCRSDITTGNPKKLEKRLKNYDILESRIAEVLEKDKLRAFHSPVRGEEIMELCNLKPGPTVGRIKKALEEAILDGKVQNDYEKVKEYFFNIKDEYMQSVQEWEKI